MGIQVKDSRRQILARIFNKLQLTLNTLPVFACCMCGYFPDPLQIKRFPLTPSFHYKSFLLELGPPVVEQTTEALSII